MTEPPRSALTGLPARTTGTWVERAPVLAPSAETQARALRVNNSTRRHRIPTMRELAALVVKGVLHLPSRYVRGMFLDITV